MTFSIVARQGGSVGVAVASKFIAVGAVVPQTRLGVGAVATQSFARVAYREEVLALLDQGVSPADALARTTAADEDRDRRQLGAVSAEGQATFTGAGCMDWAGGVTGELAEDGGTTRYAIQGNILVGEQVVLEMERAFRAGAGRPLAHRLVEALLAGDAAGGDARGRQGAAVVVATPGAGYDHAGTEVDLRVDDHPQAPTELARLLDLNDLYFSGPEDVVPLEGDVADEVATRLRTLGYDAPQVEAALGEWAGVENYEMRLVPGGIDTKVLQRLRDLTA
ncbi:DUF1028 domain-containing protein [Lapillicoccus jejuensis]|uniref:Putative Ntn-hydrolase superfamily protein n=1 Tax=Lapillicoccus jejuensis TaxID=402171 RepID=A0A542E5M0_9MICO|nr:DUF1028 domain-containing protein [Lapillicoccus jejuensis]TQJ10635.1 putative Ntn-hydrolase superfamily protein [Lapillicoccus jejuensis]